MYLEALADLPRRDLDQFIWQLPDALNGWRA
jgi:hypothetical protein